MNRLQKLLVKKYPRCDDRGIVYGNRHIATLSPRYAKLLKWVLKHLLRQKVLFRGRGSRKKAVGCSINGYRYSHAQLRQDLPLRFAERYAIYILAK